MKFLHFKDPNNNESPYSYDIERMQKVAAMNGYFLAETDARKAWECYSDSMAAGWMGLPESDTSLWLTLKYYLDE